MKRVPELGPPFRSWKKTKKQSPIFTLAQSRAQGPVLALMEITEGQGQNQGRSSHMQQRPNREAQGARRT